MKSIFIFKQSKFELAEGGCDRGWRIYVDEGKRVYGMLSQVDERHKQKIGWEIKDAARGNLGWRLLQRKWTLI